MKKSPIQAAVGVVLGTAMIGVLSAGAYAATDTSPFGMQNLSGGYMVADNMDDGGMGMKSKSKEGKCGGMKTKEGKCGGKKSHHKWFNWKMTPMAPPSPIDCTYDEDMCR